MNKAINTESLEILVAMAGPGAAVDKLGELLAAKAELDEQIKLIKKELIASGLDSVEGDFFRATVSHSSRESLDMKAVRAKLSRQFMAVHTKVSEVDTVRCVARNGS